MDYFFIFFALLNYRAYHFCRYDDNSVDPKSFVEYPLLPRFVLSGLMLAVRHMVFLIRLRCNAIPMTDDLVRMRRIPAEDKGRCMMCHDDRKENLIHMLFCAGNGLKSNRVYMRIHEPKSTTYARREQSCGVAGFMLGAGMNCKKESGTIYREYFASNMDYKTKAPDKNK
ncbi:hypothetical protein ENBRE01_2142 [Enteropsectra breve]|nr:hypothetical protein ENBRE01_2142 [Enteropsectra breve]